MTKINVRNITKNVEGMSRYRLKSRVADTLMNAARVYGEQHSGEASLIANVILSGLVDGDVGYFESDIFTQHCNLLPQVEDVDLDRDVLLADIRKLYR